MNEKEELKRCKELEALIVESTAELDWRTKRLRNAKDLPPEFALHCATGEWIDRSQPEQPRQQMPKEMVKTAPKPPPKRKTKRKRKAK